MPLVNTAMAEAAIRAKKLYEQYENRLSNYGAFAAYMAAASALLPKETLERLKGAQNARPVAFPLLTKQLLTVITERACEIAGVEVNSVKPLLSWITRGFEIKVYPKVSDNNYISEQEQFAQGMLNGLRSVLLNLDTYAAAQLEANKNTSLAATTLEGVNVVANAYQISYAQKDNLYFLLPTLMQRNDVNSSVLQNIATTEAAALMLKYESKASGNEQNLAGVLNGTLPSASNYRHFLSNRLTNGAGVSETHYIVPFGMLGVFNWIDSDAKNRRKGPNGMSAYPWTDSIMGIEWDVVEEQICDDLSATYGDDYKRTFGTKYVFASDFTFMNAYSSDNTKPIHKIELLAS